MSDLSAGEYLVQTRIQNHNYISKSINITLVYISQLDKNTVKFR